MRIAVLGAGNVGAALGRRWSGCGHEVRFFDPGRTSASALALFDELGMKAFADSAAEAAAGADLLLLATPWAAAEEAVRSAGDLAGKIILDCINPIDSAFSNLAVGHTTSAAEIIADWAPAARVVKIFNMAGFNIMADAAFPGGRPAMLYCGDDQEAKRTAAVLAVQLGFDPIDAGPLEQARTLEPMGWLLTTMIAKYGHSPEIAFALLRR